VAFGLEERPSALRNSPAAFRAENLHAEKKFQAQRSSSGTLIKRSAHQVKRSFQRSALQVERSLSAALIK